MTKQHVDTNGWIEIQDNPISRIGVFEYLGANLGDDYEPDKLYNVFRPAEELSDPETIESFRLVPWVNDHPDTLLGDPSSGRIAAEDKGVEGVIGENVYFDGDFLRANVKVFSQQLADDIKSGKKELSPGYSAIYERKKGEYNGKQYEVVQRKLRGNHLASVDEGRTGHEVRVLDSKQRGADTMEPNEQPIVKDEANLSSLMEKIADLAAKVDKLMGMEKAEAVDESEEEKKEEVKDEETSEKEGEQSLDEEEEYGKKKESMDAAVITRNVMRQLNRRNELAEELSNVIGTFDSREMTLNDVVAYGIKKLGIKCQKGQEAAVLSGYLQARSGAQSYSTVAMDSANDARAELDAFLRGGN